MNISIFDIIGPIMIGPSSSHTAGAARLSRVAAEIVNRPFSRVEFGLHGSFSKTGIGHGTDKALLAGALGIRENDERIKDVYPIAAASGIQYSFCAVDLGDAHENTCRMTFWFPEGGYSVVTGSSIGGGRIVINEIDGVKTDICIEQPTLVIRHYDKKGVISAITRLLSQEQLNISVMRLSREEKGGEALTVIETDDSISDNVVNGIRNLAHIIDVRVIRP